MICGACNSYGHLRIYSPQNRQQGRKGNGFQQQFHAQWISHPPRQGAAGPIVEEEEEEGPLGSLLTNTHNMTGRVHFTSAAGSSTDTNMPQATPQPPPDPWQLPGVTLGLGSATSQEAIMQ